MRKASCGDSGDEVASEQTPDEVLEAGELSLRLVGATSVRRPGGGTELLQRAYFAVRDAPWNTVPGVIEERSIERRPDGFSALIRQRHRYEDIDLRAELTVAGQADGTLVIGATTVAASSFSYSKIGLNLHHGLRTYRGATGRARTLNGWVTFCLDDEIKPQLIRDGTLTAMFAHFDALEIDLPTGGGAVRLRTVTASRCRTTATGATPTGRPTGRRSNTASRWTAPPDSASSRR